MKTESILLQKLNLRYPLVAVYDSPNSDMFHDIVEPVGDKRCCLFCYFKQWQKGKTLLLTKENSGCGGCGYWWFGKEHLTKEEFVKFLAEKEGLKNSNEKMEQWIIKNQTYKPQHDSLLIGPFEEELSKYVKSITFWVNADQMSVLSLAAYYFNGAESEPPIMVPFGSGCMQALTLFKDINKPQAIIGSMDIAMRKYIPADIFAFTVTLPMFRLFMDIDKDSFLSKPFLSTLIKARGGSL